MATNNTIKESLKALVTAMGGTPTGGTINEVIDSLADAIDDGDVSIEITQLDNLTDVNLTNPANGQVLIYNSTSQKWENGGIVGLPTVTADDNGKVLKVVNGVWTAVEETPAG